MIGTGTQPVDPLTPVLCLLAESLFPSLILPVQYTPYTFPPLYALDRVQAPSSRTCTALHITAPLPAPAESFAKVQIRQENVR